MNIRLKKNQKTSRNLDLIKAEVEELYNDHAEGLYLRIQALYASRYDGAIPIAPASIICDLRHSLPWGPRNRRSHVWVTIQSASCAPSFSA